MGAVEVCLFVGPTLPLSAVPAELCATCLPPVRQGDVYRVVSLLKPRAIGIIDGYFQWMPSVWHKEILWAIDQGTHVFGAASMGALRAAELAAFGMHGVGRIFEAYRDGRWGDRDETPFEDDDEVAVVHGPPELGYPALSDAMVNIRCTLASAHTQGVLGASTAAALLSIAKGLFFPDRSYARMLQAAREANLQASEIAALEAWLPGGRIDQKRADAQMLVETLQRFLAADPAPARPAFRFEHTTLWGSALRAAYAHVPQETEDQRVLDEMRLQGDRYDILRRDALRALIPVNQVAAEQVAIQLVRQLETSHAAPEAVDAAFANARREAEAFEARADVDAALIERHMLTRLAATPELDALRRRAADKWALLCVDRRMPDIEDFSELQLLQLRDWYFAQVLDGDMPDDLDRRIRDWGYADAMHFHRTLLREYAYRDKRKESEPSAAAPQAVTAKS